MDEQVSEIWYYAVLFGYKNNKELINTTVQMNIKFIMLKKPDTKGHPIV